MLDIGSGGGLTLSKLAAISKCRAAVGVEVETSRHIISSQFNRYLLTKNCDLDIPIWYVNDDIKNFPNFNGFTKIYMYDAVFTPDVMEAIAASFNASSSVKMIASTKHLPSYGFEVDFIENLGSVTARGGNMSHTFYVYESKRYSPEWLLNSDVPIKKVSESIDIAVYKEKRFNQTESLIYANQNSEKSLRPAQVHKALNVKPNDGNSSMLLFDLLSGKASAVINQTLFTLSRTAIARKSSTYELFNVKELGLVGRSEASAATHKPSKSAVIVPSYDGKEDGRILVGIITDNCRGDKSTKYIACLYDTGKETFCEVVLTSVMSMFDHDNSFPPGVDLEAILKVFRIYYLFVMYWLLIIYIIL